jgi:hypothetical protein
MSGGHFDYKQYDIQWIADCIEEELEQPSFEHTKETIKEFEYAEKLLREVYIYVKRIDWYLSCDDGEESFHRRLKQELNGTRIKSE